MGASKTSPVLGNGMWRRHARRRILPSFGALRGDNTPTAALRGLRMITRWTSSYTMLLELFGERMKEGQASPLLCSLWCLKSIQRAISPAWEPWGVYIGLPPRGTMVIRLGVGPSRLCLRPPASPPTGGPAGCRPFGRQASPTAQGSCRRLVTVTLPLVMMALSW